MFLRNSGVYIAVACVYGIVVSTVQWCVCVYGIVMCTVQWCVSTELWCLESSDVSTE